MRATLEAAPTALAVVDDRGVFRYANGHFCEILGRKPDALAEASLPSLLAPGETSLTGTTLAAFLADGSRKTTRKVNLVRGDGHAFAAKLTLTASPDMQGYVVVGLEDEGNLLEGEAKFRALFEHAGSAIGIADREGRFIAVNDAYCRMLGYSTDEITEKTVADITLPDDMPENRENIQKLFAGEIDHFTMQKRYRHKKGHVVEAILSVSAVRDLSGAPLYTIGHMVDISALKETEAKLRESESRFRALFELAGAAMGIADQEGRLLQVNAAFCRMLGYTQDELVGRTIEAITDPDDLPEYERYRELFRGERETYDVVKRYRHKEGRVVHVMVSVSMVRCAAGEPHYAVGHIVDITTLKEAEIRLRLNEERLRDLVGSIPGSVYEMDAGLNFTFDTARPSDGPLMRYDQWIKTIHPDDRHVVEKKMERIKTDRQDGTGVYLLRIDFAGGGEYRWIEVRCAFRYSPSGEFLGERGVALDVTEREEQAAKLRGSEARFRTIIDNLPIHVFETDGDMRVLFNAHSGEWERGDEFASWLDLIHPVDLTGVRRTMAEAVERKDPSLLTFRFRGKRIPDGEYAWLEVKIAGLFSQEGAFLGWRGIALDVTEQEKQAARLRESEERFRTLFEHAASGMALSASDGRLVQVNETFARMLGYSVEELAGKLITEITLPEDMPENVAKLDALYAGEIADFTVQKRYRHKDGEIVNALTSAALIRDDKGAPLYAVGHIVDITALKRAEAALRESEERFRAVFERSQTSMALIDPSDLRYLDVNQTYCDVVGYTREEMIGAHISLVTHPDELYRDINNIARLVSGESEVMRREKRYVHKNGGIVWGMLTTTPIRDGSGKVVYLAAQMVDISESKAAEGALRLSEERFRGAFESASDGMLVSDTETRILHRVNGALCAMLGYEAEELQGRCVDEITHPDDLSITPSVIRDLENGKRSVSYEKRYRRKDGTYVEVSLSVAPVEWVADGPIHVVVRVADVTEARRRGRELEETEQRFQRYITNVAVNFFRFDADLRLIVTDPRIESITETALDVKEGRKLWQDTLHPDDLPGLMEGLYEEIKVGKTHSKVFRFRSIDANRPPVWLDSYDTFLFDDDGNFLGIDGMLVDVNDKVEAEEALKKAELEYRTLVDNLPGAVYRLDENLKPILFVNKTRGSGYSESEVVAEKFDWPSLVHESDRERWRREMEEQIGQGKTNAITTSFTLNRKDGGIAWVEDFRTALFDDEGRFLGMAGVAFDSSEKVEALKALHESKRTFTTLVSNMPCVFFRTDADFNPVVYIDNIRTLGYEPEEFLEGGATFFFVITHPDDREAIWQRACEIRDAGKPHMSIRAYRAYTKSGELRWMEAFVTYLFADDGTFEGMQGVTFDITERREAEAARWQAVERFKTSFTHSPVGMGLVDRQGAWLEVNKTLCDMLGASKEELLRMRLDGIALEGKVVRERVGRGDAPLRFEEPWVALGGEILWVDVSMAPVRGEDGTLSYWILQAEDITERKAAQERQAELTGILDATSDIVAIIDTHRTPVYLNRAACRTLGVEPTGEGGVWERGKWVGRLFRAGWLRHAERDGSWSGENVILDQSGATLPVSQQIVAHKGENGAVKMYSVVARDISGVKEREAQQVRSKMQRRHEALLDELNIGVARVTIEGEVQAANEAYLRLIGAESLDDLKGVDVRTMVLDSERRDQIDSVMESEGVARDFVLELKTLQGTSYLAQMTLLLRRDDTGVYLDAVIEDITERKELEEQLTQAQKMEAIGQLTGGIAHDFNNILMSILVHGGLLESQISKDDPLTESVEGIIKAARRAADLTRSLLTFSRKQIINPRPLDLNALVGGVESLLSRTIGEDIRMRVVPSEEKLPIHADKTQIEQVLINLATNARDAMPDGGDLYIATGAVSVSADEAARYEWASPGWYAETLVTDTGEGIDKESLKKIFEPFFTTKEVGKGTGLGLSIVYGIVQQHGGFIDVYSNPGEGTSFRVLLPLRREKERDGEALPLPKPHGGTETILIAEDNDAARSALCLLLRRAGYTVLDTVNGSEAVHLYKKRGEEIALVILDVVMPVMNGKAAYDAIIALRPDVKALFVSGYTADIIHRKGILEEGLNYMPKPFAREELLRKVRALLDGTATGPEA